MIPSSHVSYSSSNACLSYHVTNPSYAVLCNNGQQAARFPFVPQVASSQTPTCRCAIAMGVLYQTCAQKSYAFFIERSGQAGVGATVDALQHMLSYAPIANPSSEPMRAAAVTMPHALTGACSCGSQCRQTARRPANNVRVLQLRQRHAKSYSDESEKSSAWLD